MLAAVLVVLSVVLQATSAQEMTTTHINKRTKVVQVQVDASRQGAAANLPLRADDFMKKYATEEFSVSSEELRLAKVLPLSNTGNAAYKYQQYANGLRIVGAELIIVENQMHGVLQAKSHSLLTNTADLAASALRISITPVEAVTLLRQYMTSKYGSKKKFNMDISSKEMVFYQGHEGKELETPIAAYELKGSSVLDIGESNYGVVYTAYIDTKTGAVIDYIARGEPSEEDKKVETGKPQTKESRSLRGREPSKTMQAITGGVVDFNDFGTASEFIVYDCLGQASCPTSPSIMWRSSTGTWPTNDEEINKAVAVSAQFARMMRAVSNQEWVTYGITARKQKIYLHIDMVNAYYDGNGIYFGQELVVDDVIAHEWAHGYCDYSSNLVYYSQSGALNEANSDILGETIDILNSQEAGTSIGDSDMIRMDSPRRMVQECGIDNWQYQRESGNDPSRWWIVGEDLDPNTLGAIRDMYRPECFGDPGSMDSNKFYCGSGDNMGVHENSGVGNRLFALMVQGGKTSGGVDLPALGFTKALSLMWNTQNAIGADTNFQEYQLELKFQCQSSIGTTFPLPDFKTGASNPDATNGLLTLTDCDNLKSIIEAGKLAYEVDYSSCTIIVPGPPTAEPTGPTFSPTIPPPIPAKFPAYTASGGSTVDETVYVCDGQSIEFSLCPGVGECTGDTKLSLYDGRLEIATNDDSCGLCSSLQFDFVGPCRVYTLQQGCYGSVSCGGRVTLVQETPTNTPTKTPTRAPNGLTAVPTFTPPTFSPTTPPPIPGTFPAYNTAGGITVDETVYVCPGQSIEFSMCPGVGQCAFDTKLTLYDGNNNQVATNDDSCGLCSSLQFDFVGACQTYTLKQGCYDISSCGGQVTLLVNGGTVAPTKTPTMSPDGLTVSPTITAPIPDNFPAYYTADGSTVDETVYVCAGQSIEFSTCRGVGQCDGDTKLYLYDGNNNLVEEMDDSCGLCASLQFDFVSACQTYTLKQACYGTSSCSGQVKLLLSGSIPTAIPTLTLSTAPSVDPAGSPTRKPTLTPTWRPTLPPTKTPSWKPTNGPPTNTPTRSPTKRPTWTPTWTPTRTPTTGTGTVDCSGIPDYVAKKKYQKNNQVKYGNQLYKSLKSKNKKRMPAAWWWALQGTCAVVASPCDNIAAWKASKLFRKNNQVIFQDVLYKAKRNNKGKNPKTNTVFWGEVGNC